MHRVLVINPNSSTAVTADIAHAVSRVDPGAGIDYRCIDIPEAPVGIESHADVDAVIPLLEAVISRSEFDAYVIACFSDPGIGALRRTTSKPVFGIGQCAFLQAMALGERFGIVALRPASTERQRKYVGELGFTKRMAATIPIDLGVTELANEDLAWDRISGVGRELVAQGADVLILGCAGMVRYRERLRDAVNRPVVDPTAAAAAMVSLSLQHA